MYTIDPYGPSLLYALCPGGASVHGTITRASGETGALVQTRAGIYAQCNAGVIRTLDQSAVYAALRQAATQRG